MKEPFGKGERLAFHRWELAKRHMDGLEKKYQDSGETLDT